MAALERREQKGGKRGGICGTCKKWWHTQKWGFPRVAWGLHKQKRPTEKGGADVFGGAETLKNKLSSDMRGPSRGKGGNQ
jgi:hypothetical protein